MASSAKIRVMHLQSAFPKTASRQNSLCRAFASSEKRSERRAASRVWARRREKTASGKSLYNYFRDYDPSTGRFLTGDPLGVVITRIAFGRKAGRFNPTLNHLYSYVDSNPLSFVDPDGLTAVGTMGRLIGGAAAGGARGAAGGVLGLTLGLGAGAILSQCEAPTEREKCERRCDETSKRDATFCHAMAVMKGKKGTKAYEKAYSECMEKSDEAYIECYQDCKRDYQ